MSANLVESIKPLWRAVKYGYLGWSGRRTVARTDATLAAEAPPMAFIIGCGRSGTTLLGQMLALHPRVAYLNEPYHLWSAIDARTDCTGMYQRRPGRAFLDAKDVDAASLMRFRQVMSRIHRERAAGLIVEKTPLNTLRIGYLRELAAGAKFIHLVRDGVEVVRSIQRLAAGGEAVIAGRRPVNRWWGEDDRKWRILADEGAKLGYWPHGVGQISGEDHASRAAYEWLISLAEVHRHHGELAGNLLEIRYDQLSREPGHALRRIGRFLSLREIDAWADRAAALIRPVQRRHDVPALPPLLHDAFWAMQARYGWESGLAAQSRKIAALA